MNHFFYKSTFFTALTLLMFIAPAASTLQQLEARIKKLEEEAVKAKTVTASNKFTCKAYNNCIGKTYTASGATEKEARAALFKVANEKTQKRVACISNPTCEKKDD